MTIRYNVTGDARKALVSAISEILNQPVFYEGTPTFAYKVGSCTIDRHGTVSFPDDARLNTIVWLLAALRERGFESEDPDVGEVPDLDSDDNDRLTIDMPFDGFTEKTFENLGEIVASKNRLIKKALGTDSLRIDVTDDKLRFPWFTLTGTDGEVDAYMRFVTALCDMAKTLKRITAKEKPMENDKFAMRLFLIRLGFVGPEYKQARKILLRNLSGNTAWKDGPPPAKPGERVDEP